MEKDMNRQNLFTSNSNKGSILKVLFKLGVFLSISLIIFWKFISPQYLYQYNSSLIDKMDRLKKTNDPKIVLVGNSNLSFGIRSELIKNTFGMEVVNLGLHGGLGNAFHEEMAKANVNTGDILIICHTSFSDDSKSMNPELEWTTIENNFYLWTCVPDDEWYNMALAFPTYAKKCINLFLKGTGNQIPQETSYSRLAFNEYGDNIFSETHTEHFLLPKDYDPSAPLINDTCIERLNKLNEYITDKGATLLIAGYPIAYKDKKPDAQVFNNFKEELQSKLEFPVISDYTDYFYPQEYFYNTEYHLTNDAANIRTEQLINDLKNYLKNNNVLSKKH